MKLYKINKAEDEIFKTGSKLILIMTLETLIQAIQLPLQQIVSNFVNLTPNFFSSLLVLIIGYVVGKVVGKIVYLILAKVINIDGWLKKKKLENALYKVNVSSLFSELIKWYVYVLFIYQASIFLPFEIFSEFLKTLVFILPKAIAGVAIFAISLLLGEFVRLKILQTKFPFKQHVGSGAKFLIAYIVLVFILQTLGFQVDILIEAFRMGTLALVLTFSIALGIGLGFAFRDEIQKIIKEAKKKTK